MTLNARFVLKCAQWTVRLTYVCCRFRIRPYAQVQPEGAQGWAGGPSPPPCGQLTRCFSAVAELLVLLKQPSVLHVDIPYLTSQSYKVKHFLPIIHGCTYYRLPSCCSVLICIVMPCIFSSFIEVDEPMKLSDFSHKFFILLLLCLLLLLLLLLSAFWC